MTRHHGALRGAIGRYPSGTLGAVVLILLVISVTIGPLLWRIAPDTQDLAIRLMDPSGAHPLGTDPLGRDVLSRLLHGGRISLVIAVSSVLAGLIVGAVIGMTAAVFGAAVEAAAMRMIDALLAVPGVVLAVILTAIMGQGIAALVTALAIYGTPLFARVAFTSSKQVISGEFVLAAEAIGATRTRILLRHVAPNIVTPLLTLGTVRAGANLLIAAALNFFGLGVQPPTAEWGLMIADGSSYSWNHAYLLIAPGGALFLASLGLNWFGDGLRDSLDPRQSRT